MSSGTQYKQNRILNWKEYNQALVNRGSITFWFQGDIAKIWFFHGEKTGRGVFKTYSDQAIQFCLMLKGVFKLPLRALEGFLNSAFDLLGLHLVSPDYSLFSKRAGSLAIEISRRLPEGPVNVVVDSTGLHVYGEGEWRARKYGAGTYQRWNKLHFAANPDNQDFIAVELTTEHVGDPTVLPALLDQLGEQKVGRCYGDGAFDTRGSYEAIANHGGEAVIPPRDNAAYWEAGHPRNRAVAACRKDGRAAWKRQVDYTSTSSAQAIAAAWPRRRLTASNNSSGGDCPPVFQQTREPKFMRGLPPSTA